MKRVDLVVMNGWGGGSEARCMVDGARRAITRDLVDKALSTDVFASIIVSTNDPVLVDAVNGQGVLVEFDPPGEEFHFGIRLQQLIAKHDIERIVYLGGGCAPLLSAEAVRDIAERIGRADRLLVANNFYSVDWCAFTPASVLLSVEPPENDNALGWLLANEAGLPAEELPRTTATSFDVDTPTDLFVLALHPDVSQHARAYLDDLPLSTDRIEAAIAVFVDRQAEALISGRVSSKTMAYLGREVVCRTRVFSEERGMRADGRLARQEVRSLLGMYMESVGVERLFQDAIPELGQAAFIDDRVLWAHHRVWPLIDDRFNSDLFRPECITDPFIRGFTEAAMACPIPVVLGGHSLVSGGLQVLVEAAWARSGIDLERQLRVAQ